MFKVLVLKELYNSQVNQILEIVLNASETDGARPFSEHVELHLRSGGDRPVIHLVVQNDLNKIVGYGHLDITDLVAGPSGELVVHPDFRLKGIATQIVNEMKNLIGDKPLRLWSHGDTDIAKQFSEKLGFNSIRNIIQMRRSLFAPIDNFSFPQNFSTRNFETSKDFDIFLELNKKCFKDLPDQGSWTSKDLELRIKESWFNPEGFLLVEDEKKQLVGFCWTKVHGQDHNHEIDDGHSHLSHGHEPIGELYVIGVDPDHQNLGLGKTLTLWGLNHLRRNGLDSAMLYVDSDNKKAINLYTSLGFGFWGLDRLYKSRNK